MKEMRAALYARVASKTPQKKHAVLSQLEALRDHASSSGMKIIEEFTDEGYSGLRLDRPGLDRMRDLAEQRGFDVLLVCGPDRLARNVARLVLILEELERYGVRTIFPITVEDPLSKLHEITEAGAEFARAQLTVRDSFSTPAPETNLSADALSSERGREIFFPQHGE